MSKIDIKAFAKINLTLDVLYKRPDGYHEVEMIMQNINLKDKIQIQLTSEKEISLECDCDILPTDGKNLAYKAAMLMTSMFDLDAGIKIKLYKNIPLAAGLAGGSADAAAVILGINRLFDLKLPLKELMALGKELGADIPFCIHGGTALARGIGEKIYPIDSYPNFGLVLVKPPFNVFTRQVYSRLDIKNIKKRPDNEKMIRALKNHDIKLLAKGLCNVMEDTTFEMFPRLLIIKEELLKKGALGALMSGSGPTIYGIFEDKKQAQRAAKSLDFYDSKIFVTDVYKGEDIFGP